MNYKLAVSPDGNDNWSGRLAKANDAGDDGPLRSLAAAQQAVRALKAAEGLPTDGVVVEVADGEYRLDAPLTLTAEDGGTSEAPIVYRSAAGADVCLTGGVHITDWQTVDDPAILARLASKARGQVLWADLPAHGVTDFGVMQSGPRWAHSDPGLEVLCRDQPMTLARYPNEGYLHIASLSVEDGHHIRRTHGSRVGQFRVEGEADRLRRWAAESAPMLHGYWFWDWADQRLAVTEIDSDTGEITLDDQQPHQYGYRAGQWFYAFNLLCELDFPGEWYLDRDIGRLYFWPPHTLEPEDAVVSVLRDGDTVWEYWNPEGESFYRATRYAFEDSAILALNTALRTRDRS